MGLETGNHIDDLTPTNPGSGDARSQGDDHLRNIKQWMLNDINGFGGGTLLYGSSTTGNATYVFSTSSRTVTAYNTGQIVVLTTDAASDGSPTLNIDSDGAKNILNLNGIPPTAGEMPVGTHVLYYDGTDFLLLSSPEVGENIVINGSGRVQQRANATLSTSYQYAGDRFAWKGTGTITTGTATTVSSGNIGGYAHQLNTLTTVGGSVISCRYRVESKDSDQLRGIYATVSFKIYHNQGGDVDFTTTVYDCNVTDTFSAVTITETAQTDTISSGTATHVVYTLDLSSHNPERGLEIVISSASTNWSSDLIEITDFKIERGKIATPYFDRVTVDELAMCQRYYEKSYGIGTDPAAATTNGCSTFVATANNAQYGSRVQYSTRKRAAATITLYGTESGTSAGNVYNQDGTADEAATTTFSGGSGFIVSVTSTPTAGHRYRFHWTAESELS